MILHPNVLSDLAHLQHQDRLREVEIWRLAREARQSRAKFVGHLFHRLFVFAREQLRVQARPKSVTPDLADLRR
ncbi:MAG: hypothetical protein L6R45_02695 [Anaerolineae bacterium]|nr:hypothetical protein [Anaerolineae bacterium]